MSLSELPIEVFEQILTHVPDLKNLRQTNKHFRSLLGHYAHLKWVRKYGSNAYEKYPIRESVNSSKYHAVRRKLASRVGDVRYLFKRAVKKRDKDTLKELFDGPHKDKVMKMLEYEKRVNSLYEPRGKDKFEGLELPDVPIAPYEQRVTELGLSLYQARDEPFPTDGTSIWPTNDAKIKEFDSNLLNCIRYGCLEMARAYLEFGVNVKNGLLYEAMAKGNIEMIKLLMEYAIEIELLCLIEAVANDQIEIFKLLLSKVPESSRLDDIIQPLVNQRIFSVGYVSPQQRLKFLEAFQKSGVYFNYDELQNQVSKCTDLKMIRLMIEKRVLLKNVYAHCDDCTAIQIAISKDDMILAKQLLEHGMFDTRVFLRSVKEGKYETVEMFLDYTGSVERRSVLEYALDHGINAGQWTIVELLLKRGANAKRLYEHEIRKVLEEKPAMFELLLDYGLSLNKSAFRVAAEEGWHELIERLLSKEEVMRPTDFRDYFYYAARKGCLKTINLLLEHGVDARYNLVDTVSSGNVESVKLFLKRGGKVYCNCKCALMEAVKVNSPEIVKLLLDSGKIEKARILGACKLAVYRSDRQGYECLKEFLVFNASNALIDHEWLLCQAVESSNPQPILDLMVDSGISVHDVCSTQTLRDYMEDLKWETVQLLVQYGAAVDSETFEYACTKGNAEIVQLMLDKVPALKECVDKAFIMAAKFRNLSVAAVLAKHGADIHADNEYALRIASASAKSESEINWLLDSGADVFVGDSEPLRIAAWSGNVTMFQCLVSRGQSFKLIAADILLMAQKRGHADIVKILTDDSTKN